VLAIPQKSDLVMSALGGGEGGEGGEESMAVPFCRISCCSTTSATIPRRSCAGGGDLRVTMMVYPMNSEAMMRGFEAEHVGCDVLNPTHRLPVPAKDGGIKTRQDGVKSGLRTLEEQYWYSRIGCWLFGDSDDPPVLDSCTEYRGLSLEAFPRAPLLPILVSDARFKLQ
jgi:hypothetical protein